LHPRPAPTYASTRPISLPAHSPFRPEADAYAFSDFDRRGAMLWLSIGFIVLLREEEKAA
jgi:hypothetical protein